MVNLFIMKLILSFFIGCIWVIAVTVIAEKYGSKIGGIIAGLPSTSLLTLFFIALTQGTEKASEAAIIIPFMVGATALFVLVYILLSKTNFYLGIISSILLWLIISTIIVVVKLQNLFYSFLGLVLFTSLSYFVLEKMLSISSHQKKEMHYTFFQLGFRGILTGIIIVLGVILSYSAGALYGGIIASFPVLLLSTMVITYREHGYAFSAAVMKVSMLSAAINMSLYALAVYYFYPAYGLIYGTLLCLFSSLIVGISSYFIIHKLME